MKAGKLPPELLEELVLDKLTARRPEVIVHSTTGQDSCFISTNGLPVVMSTDPITGEVERIGWFAIHVACNDLAANGAEPIGVMLTILLPVGTSVDQIDEIMTDASAAATELNIDILGGHTEITDSVNRPVISTTAIGKPLGYPYVVSEAVYAGLDIVLTKGAGIEGTAILATVRSEELRGRIPDDLLARAASLTTQLSVVPESRIAVETGVIAMHDVTEGGVLGALYEVVQAAGCGFVIDEDAVLVLPETRAIAEFYQIDFLRLISSGSMLIFTDKGAAMIAALAAQGIRSSIIGHTVNEEKYTMITQGVATKVAPPDSDELWRILS